MSARILIVEDEFLVAMDISMVLEELGHEVVGVAADSRTAYALAERGCDLALVDLNLRDGATGPGIGAHLAQELDVGVIFITANPRLLGDGVDGTIGVLTKPTDLDAVTEAVDFALALRSGTPPPRAPAPLQLFA